MVVVALGLVIAPVAGAMARPAHAAPGLPWTGPGVASGSVPWNIVVLLTLLTLLPALLLAMTPFARLLVVFHFLRHQSRRVCRGARVRAATGGADGGRQGAQFAGAADQAGGYRAVEIGHLKLYAVVAAVLAAIYRAQERAQRAPAGAA